LLIGRRRVPESLALIPKVVFPNCQLPTTSVVKKKDSESAVPDRAAVEKAKNAHFSRKKFGVPKGAMQWKDATVANIG
jgi:hypothetical protein